jgi:hypothetical protein
VLEARSSPVAVYLVLATGESLLDMLDPRHEVCAGMYDCVDRTIALIALILDMV